ncbi:MAG: hypothetical protein WCD13_19475, partial [Pseudolabrys sp.]
YGVGAHGLAAAGDRCKDASTQRDVAAIANAHLQPAPRLEMHCRMAGTIPNNQTPATGLIVELMTYTTFLDLAHVSSEDIDRPF